VIRVLLTQKALAMVESQLAELPVTPVLLDGRVEDIEVAWGSSDVYRDGAARQFFGAVTHSPTMKWLQVSNAGTDDPVFGRLVAAGVVVTTSHVTGPPIAEYVMRAVLDWYQDADAWRASVREHQWKAHEFREVLGTTWLVVGLGAIGEAVAVRARAFGAHVIGVRRTARGDEPVDELVAPDALLDVLPRADVVVLAAPAVASTVGMVDDAFLRSMKPRSVLVNAARGALVDEAALLAALDRGVPEAALLDVAASEPPDDDSPLWTRPNVVLTPHSSALGDGRHGRAASFFVENLRRYIDGEPLVHVVTAEETLGGR
jgi:phosphoglycerate dehydrogenase-like enzyme